MLKKYISRDPFLVNAFFNDDIEGNVYKKLGPDNPPVFISGTFLPEDIIIG